MRSNFSYWLTDFAVKLLTLDSIVFKKLISSNIDRTKISKVLDIGCGTGTQAPLFSKKKYLGIDIDPGAISYAKNLHPEYKFLVADATDFKLHEKFDFVLVVGVFHHLNNKEVNKSLSCIKQHLTTKGKILIIEAIPPLFKWNVFGYYLRSRDRGDHIRKLTAYEKLIKKYFSIDISKNVYGGFFDYAFITGNHKTSKKTS